MKNTVHLTGRGDDNHLLWVAGMWTKVPLASGRDKKSGDMVLMVQNVKRPVPALSTKLITLSVGGSFLQVHVQADLPHQALGMQDMRQRGGGLDEK